MSDTMRAVVKTRPERGAELLTHPIPRIAPHEVLLKVRATSICGTDVHIYKWDKWSQGRIGDARLPQVLGHEMTGDVVEVGAHCRRVKVGDNISVETHIPDPSDLQSLVGQMHIGEGMKIVGVDRDGCFADYFAVPEVVCWLNDSSIPPEFASIQEPLGNATYCLLGEDGDVAGKSVVILGDGPIGLMAAAIARAVGLTQIFVVGLFGHCLEIARKVGADHTLNAGDATLDRVAYVKDHTGGFGADIVLEMAGAAAAVEEGFKMLRKGGRYSAFGVLGDARISLDYNADFVFKASRVYGINGRRMFDTWYRVRNLLASGRLDPTPIITGLISLEDYETGFAQMMDVPRRSAKIVMFPDADLLRDALQRRAADNVSAG
ncbi:MAG: zinc-binding dehydrogenase [Calditrichaeota bacterium]|nr:zinc-binding dehydrogenase [Calditrichota bacterium]